MRLIVIILLLLVQTFAFAQTKQMSLEDAVYGRYTYLYPESMSGLQWMDDEHFSFIEDKSIVAESAKSGEKSTVFSLNELNEITGANLQRIPSYRWIGQTDLLISDAKKYWLVDSNTKNVKYKIELPENADNASFSEEGQYVAFTQGHDLFVALANGTTKQITSDGGNGIVNGQTVHRNEFGISGGIFNSPKGNFVAFYRKDESMVKDYPLVDFMARQAELTPVKYPMAGMASHHVTLGVYNIESGVTTFLKTGEPLDHFLTNVAWSPDEKSIYMAELNREQNHMQLNCYDVVTGEKVKTLFEESSDTYVEPLYPVQFSKVNPGEFYYLSRLDGWFHVYKYNTDGKLVQQITKGEWEVTNILGFDAKEKTLFVEATLDDPLQNNIYKVDVKSGETERLSKEDGVHGGTLSPDAAYVLDRWSGTEVPGKVDLISSNGKNTRTIFASEDPLKDYQLGENKLVSLKTKDGKYDLFGRLILPNDFDPAKKYPVVVYVYGGPHSQLVTKGWQNQARWWQYYMASQGYIAFTLDNRGTNNRGRAFETAIHRNLGVLETEDQMQGIEYLLSLPYVDADRIGVHGWSYGGFMTLNLKLKHPEIFKVAAAGGPVVDWSMYEIMYGERYMDMPQENPEGYKNSDMTKYVENLDGKLMLIHGVQDATVVMQHSMKFLRECVKQNKQVDFFAYPIHEHNVRGKDRVHLMEKVSRYFFENL
ncbi:prolyl tripeptidyl peptidase. Serine peptidase. MEROPS family S09B [Draconibacterium orientale]|uniref:Peptidase S9 n=1 Tax=Draconibacterium orientale TaxID=1168034 RepID=X5E1Q2_9BACT|nr:S9 family peptidase [Draconibacterium orientale]AHW60516.1 peptidase S9 [Draconibacterium orientale]SET44340.1 prolyl tripeptidyl peptidase. Serine peptidase. MEROPS family S09B [Draconibacterium orientale]